MRPDGWRPVITSVLYEFFICFAPTFATEVFLNLPPSDLRQGYNVSTPHSSVFPAVTLNHTALKGGSGSTLKTKKGAQNLGDFMLKQKKRRKMTAWGIWLTDTEENLPEVWFVFLVNMKRNFY